MFGACTCWRILLWHVGSLGASTHNKAIISSSAHTPFRESDRGPLGKWAGAFGSAINFPQLNAWDEICRVPRHATHEWHERTSTWQLALQAARSRRAEQETTQHLRLRADWIESGQREGRAGDHTKQVHVHQSRSRTDEADEPGKWHAEPPLSVSPSLPFPVPAPPRSRGNPNEHRPNTDSMILQRSWPLFSPSLYRTNANQRSWLAKVQQAESA